MKYHKFLTSAAVAAVLATSGTANAQLLGGGATGGLGGSITGGLGNIGATGSGTLNGSVRGTTDALGRTREIGSRATDRVKGTAASHKEPGGVRSRGRRIDGLRHDGQEQSARRRTRPTRSPRPLTPQAKSARALTSRPKTFRATVGGNAAGNGAGALDRRPGGPRA